MNNAKINVDTRSILKLFANLSSKKQATVYKNALKKAANILVKETRKQLKHDVKLNKSKMSKGIRISKKSNDKKATVHIMGDYRLRFFENGTATRKKKSGSSTGKITATHFFERARNNKEKEVFDSINKNIRDEIIKISRYNR